MPELAAQITAPRVVPQTDPTCDHCGAVLVLSPIERDCCHKHTLDIQGMQFDSARQVGRYVIWLSKRVATLEEQILELETRPRKGKA